MLVLDMLKGIIGIVAVCHFVACFWYWIGTMEHAIGGWVKEENGGLAWEAHDIYYRYTSSLHWALSQLTGGMDEITCTNPTERIFTICIFLSAFIIAAAFVSNLTSALTRLELITSRRRTQISALRKYMTHHGISRRLMQRLQRNAIHRMSEREKIVSEASVELIQMISDSLRVELHFEMYSGVFACHDFFSYYMRECPHVMRQVCHNAVTSHHASAGDLLFCTGEKPAEPKMYILRTGSLQYTSIAGATQPVDRKRQIAEGVKCVCGNMFMSDSVFCRKCGAKKPEETPASMRTQGFAPGVAPKKPEEYTSNAGATQTVVRKRQIAEAVLWTDWIHRGVCAATIDCVLCVLSAREFMTIVSRYNHPDFDPSKYAGAFVRDLNVFQQYVTDVTNMAELGEYLCMCSEVNEGTWRPSKGGGGASWRRSPVKGLGRLSVRSPRISASLGLTG